MESSRTELTIIRQNPELVGGSLILSADGVPASAVRALDRRSPQVRQFHRLVREREKADDPCCRLLGAPCHLVREEVPESGTGDSLRWWEVENLIKHAGIVPTADQVAELIRQLGAQPPGW